MEERRTDTEETFSDQPLPATQSDQNREEPSAPHGGGGDGGDGGDASQADRTSTGNPGAAEEGSQSTGHPDNAG